MAVLCAAYSPAGKEWLQECYAYICENYEWVKAFCQKELTSLRLMEMESSYLIWVDVSATGLTDEEFTQRLAQEAGVLVQAGTCFGSAGAGYVRINLGTSRARVQEAFHRIKDWLNAL
nr:aminotransferase class I/II-fold pyridoxal phosphate-dependent enzyme [Vaginisenegalia massiliensis]